ncbi:MAG: hypothetical protein M3P98_03105 [bacterium]|nr:hypothetical protein [bacterium]
MENILGFKRKPKIEIIPTSRDANRNKNRRGPASDTPFIGKTEGGHSFIGGDPSDAASWKKIGTVEDAHEFMGGDPSEKDNWKPRVNDEQEASLEFMKRAQYSIEPIQSNRKAFLEREFGQENIMEDKKGDLYLKQNGSFLPLNKPGLSTADLADFAGATPEMVGGIAGGVTGIIAGLPAGGTASVPLATGMGAMGAGTGSAFRQGLSSAIGTPQVATLEERALETGISAGIGGLASGAGAYIKPLASKALGGISQFIKNLGKGELDSASKTTTKTIGNQAIEMGGEIKPQALTAADIMGEITDQSSREMVQENEKKLGEIALREGLPLPSPGQAAQGKAIIAENKIMDMPLIGGNARKKADGQAKLIKANLEGITGRKIDFDNDVGVVGQTVKEFAETVVASRKKISQELYQAVEEEGADVMIGKRSLLNQYKNEAAKHGLIDPLGNRTAYDVSTEMTEETFNKLQKVIFQGIDSLTRNPSLKVRFQAANALVKTLKANAKAMKVSDPDGHRLIQGFITNLNSTLETTLNKEAPGLGAKFLAANKNYSIYKTQDKIFKSLIGDKVANEHVVKTIMNSTKKIGELKELIGEERVKEIGKSYIADILYKLNKSGVARADSALEAIRRSASQIRETIGVDDYRKLVDNLTYLNSTSRPLTISRESLNNLLDNRGSGWKAYVAKFYGMASTVAESKGTTVTKMTANKAKESIGKVFETTGKMVPTTEKGLSAAANLVTDNPQRSLSTFPQYKGGSMAERDKEIEKRKRAISGDKNGTR